MPGVTAHRVTAKTFSSIKATLDGISTKTMEEHYKLYQGYINKYNEVMEKLDAADKSKANQVFSDVRSLKIDLTFANGLRSILRQDPDVIMVGEIRDVETAEIAIHASLTGHLVFSTLHTNDSAGAISRLLDMGIESFLVSSSVVAIIAQRLVRVVCSDCRLSYPPPKEELEKLGLKMNPEKSFTEEKVAQPA